MFTSTVVTSLFSFGWSFLSDALKGEAQNTAVDKIKSSLDEKKLEKEYENFLESQQNLHELSFSVESEFDFQGLLNFLSSNLKNDCKQYFAELNPTKRDEFLHNIVERACDWSGADNTESRNKVADIVTATLSIIRSFYDQKVKTEDRILAAQVVSGMADEVNKHTDQNTARVIQEIHKLSLYTCSGSDITPSNDEVRQSPFETAEEKEDTQSVGGQREEQQTTSFQQQEKNAERQRIADLCRSASARFLQNEIRPNILPGIACEDKTFTGEHGLAEFLQYCWKEKQHAVLTADGGMGKTTLLLYAATQLLNKGGDETTSPALYISLEMLEAANLSIEAYACRVLFGSEKKTDRLYELTNTRCYEPALILFLDGFNELQGDSESKFAKEIKTLSFYPGIQIVVTSREDFSDRTGIRFLQASLSSISEEQIKSILTEKECENISEELRELLHTPMLLLMYKDICPLIDKHRSSFLNWSTPINKAAELLSDFYLSQIAVLLDRNDISGEKVLKVCIIISLVVPYIGHYYEGTGHLSLTEDEFDDTLKWAVSDLYEKSGMLNLASEDNKSETIKAIRQIQKHYRLRSLPSIETFDVRDYLLTESHLMHEADGRISFPHQIYRDYLSARWIVDQSLACEKDGVVAGLWNARFIPGYVQEYIRNLSGAYWSEDNVNGKGIAARIADSARRSEDTAILAYNLLDTFPYTETSGVPDLSGLDLRGVRLKDYADSPNIPISLKGAKIDQETLVISSCRQVSFQCFTFSNDSQWLAAKTDGNVYIWNVNSGRKCLQYSDRYYNVGLFQFTDDGGYLLFSPMSSSEERIDVYALDRTSGLWFKCYDKTPDGKNLKSFISSHYESEKAEEMTFGKNSGDDPADRSFQRKKSPDGKSEVRYYSDGTVALYRGKSLSYILARGNIILQAAAISADGKRAVTMGQNIFGLHYDQAVERYCGFRKLQLWDLKKRRRIRTLSCDDNIVNVQLSGKGHFIVCERGSGESSQVIKWDGKSSYEVQGSFISNQYGKLTFYGDKAILKTPDGRLELFDLASGEGTVLDADYSYEYESRSRIQRKSEEKPDQIRLAAFTPNGEIVWIGKKKNYLRVPGVSSGLDSNLNRENAPVTGLSFMEHQPFVAVATGNGMVSIYHTRTGQRIRILKPKTGNKMIVGHPSKDSIACCGGNYSFELFYLWEDPDRVNAKSGKHYSHWKQYRFASSLDGRILDMDFNEVNEELVVIADNGEIIYCDDCNATEHSRARIITNFSVDQYDFAGVECSEDLKEVLRNNGAKV